MKKVIGLNVLLLFALLLVACGGSTGGGGDEGPFRVAVVMPSAINDLAFSQSIYDKFSQVDRQTHMLGTELGLDLKRADPAISLYYINSRLDGSQFLEMVRVSPSVSGFLAQKWFARGAYVYSDKTLHDRDGRDATTNAGESDLYFFVRGLRQYFNIGYRYRDEDADADQYDYISNSFKIRDEVLTKDA